MSGHYRTTPTSDAKRRRPGYLTKRTPARASWRRSLREPPRDLNSFLLANRIGGSVIDLDIVLDTIRQAWVPHRTYSSLDRDLHKSSSIDRRSPPVADMGTGGRMTRNCRGRPAAPVLAGLPHRRYSVPETIMRKYNLTKQHSDSNSEGAVTVPNVTPENMGVATSKSGLGKSSTPRGGRTPPGDRRRRTGKGFEENTFRRPENGQPKIRKRPPMYKGAKGNQESVSEESDVQEITELLNNNNVSPPEEMKSPDCVECKNFLLEVIAEESEKASSKSRKCSSERSPAAVGNNETSDVKSPKHQQTASELEDEIVAEVLLQSAQHQSSKNSSQEAIDSPGSSSLPIEEIEDGYNQQRYMTSQTNSPRFSSESQHSDLVQDRHSPSYMTTEVHMLNSSSPESSLEKTSGFSDQTTPEERGDTTPREGEGSTPGGIEEEVSPDSGKTVPRLNLGLGSSSPSPTSTPPSSDRPSGESSYVNDRTSSVTLYQPNTDRSSSTQDSTMSIPSDSLPRSSNSPRDADKVTTQSTQTQLQSGTTATNTDTPVTMATTATNTDQCGYTNQRDTPRTPQELAVSPLSVDEAESHSLPVSNEIEYDAISNFSKSSSKGTETDFLTQSNFCGTKFDPPLKSPQSIPEVLRQSYPINRPFSMSRSTEEKYANAARTSDLPPVDPPRSELVFSSESRYAEDRESNTMWSEQFDEDEYTKLTHQRQRYWMSKKPETSLPVTPVGALSTVGTGTVYRKHNFDSQLVVPRYSALPRTVSMLVNTSSQDCSSNSSDSECLSLVDSLDEVPISPKHFRAEDVVEMLPESAAIPREKAKAFFVPMDEPSELNTSSPVVAAMLPEKLKQRLSSRHEVINMKRQQQADAREQKEKEAREREAREQKEKIAKARKELRAKKAEKKVSKDRSRSLENSPRETELLSEQSDGMRTKRKSSIPVMRSPTDLQKSPRSSQTGSSQKPSHLPVRRRHQSPPVRRSANLLNRFQQRFEVIPEERSVSMESSIEESRLLDRARSVSLPTSKLTSQDSTSPREVTRTKRSDRPPRPVRVLKTSGPLIDSIMIQEVDDLDEPIKDSYKGRAALAPHTDEGMSSLSKGWINFYLLKDGKSSPETSSGADVGSKSKASPLKTVNVVGGSGNRIRTYTVPSQSQAETKPPPSVATLPDLKSASRKPSSDDNSSDGKRITTYLHLPSPRVQPPHLFNGSEERASSESSSVSSSEETERSTSPALLPVRWPIRQQHRRSKLQHFRPEAGQHTRLTSANVGVGWTVTVAGSNNQSQPDVEMRLTFPSSARRPPNSQSDSGLGEDNNNNANNKSNQEENRQTKKQHFLPPATATQGQQRWTLTVKNGPERLVQDFQRTEKNLFQCLPELPHQQGQSKSSKKANKRLPLTTTTLGDGYSAVWPRDEGLITTKVIIRKTTARYSREVRSVSQLLAEDTEEGLVLRSGLAVTGSAISPEKKPRVQTMSEKDLTRGHTARR